MAFHGYVHFEDADKGSQIKGTSEKKETCNDGKTTEAMCLVQSAQHILRMPYNEQNGRPTAEAVHFPYQLTINMDRATPELYKHMVEKRPLNVTIYFFGSSPENPETHNWFTISMTDARIVELHLRKSMNIGGNKDLPDLVDLGFTYYHIKWEDHDDSQEAEDSWGEAGGTAKRAPK